jgi:hypothetical protein
MSRRYCMPMTVNERLTHVAPVEVYIGGVETWRREPHSRWRALWADSVVNATH